VNKLLLAFLLAAPSLALADASKERPAAEHKLPRGYYENQLFSGNKEAPSTSKGPFVPNHPVSKQK
jgi:hypothetical protein